MSKIVQWELAFRLYLGLFTLQGDFQGSKLQGQSEIFEMKPRK